jgi:glycosyltransferase involved in cell wall biosynthesis
VKLPARLFVAAHTTRIYGPVQALTAWLLRERADFTLAALPFGYSGLPHAVEQRYTAGKLAVETPGHASRGWEPWLWVKDWCFVLRRGWRAGAGAPVDLFVGVDCLNASAGLVLRALGRVRRVAFYVIDYTPKRFKNPVLNAVYARVDRLAATRSDMVWNLSERMRDVRRGQGVAEDRNRLVPVGVELGGVAAVPRAKVKRRSLLYMGALMHDKGLQLMVDAFPEVLKKVPDAELHILGFGPFEAELKRLVKASPARARIRVPGGLAHDALFKVVPGYGVALAPYLDDPGSYTWWCDPTKPKEYLACGLPVIITRVPWIWERVADPRKPLGLAIDYRRGELVEACVRLLKDDRFYWRCRRNALEFAATLGWDGIYARAFKGSGPVPGAA